MYTDTRLLGPNVDIDELLNTLKTPWKTMNSDMDTARTIISNHAKTEIEIKSAPLLSFIGQGNDIEITFPSWQGDVEKTFLHQYGLIDGKLIFNKVLMRIFQLAKGTEQQLH